MNELKPKTENNVVEKNGEKRITQRPVNKAKFIVKDEMEDDFPYLSDYLCSIE